MHSEPEPVVVDVTGPPLVVAVAVALEPDVLALIALEVAVVLLVSTADVLAPEVEVVDPSLPPVLESLVVLLEVAPTAAEPPALLWAPEPPEPPPELVSVSVYEPESLSESVFEPEPEPEPEPELGPESGFVVADEPSCFLSSTWVAVELQARVIAIAKTAQRPLPKCFRGP